MAIEDPATGCFDTTSTTVEQNINFTLTMASLSPTCLGDDNGQASVLINGGLPPFTFLWNDPSGQTTDTALNLTAGTYSVLVTDAQGCFDNGSIVVPQGDSLELSITGSDVTCNGANRWPAVVNVNGGTPLSISMVKWRGLYN